MIYPNNTKQENFLARVYEFSFVKIIFDNEVKSKNNLMRVKNKLMLNIIFSSRYKKNYHPERGGSGSCGNSK